MNHNHTFSRKKEEAGREWLGCFMTHHSNELSLRTLEATSAAKARAFNEVSVAAFYNILEREQNDKMYTTYIIFNVDETGISTVPNRPTRIIAKREKKQIGSLSPAERGQLVTVEI